MEYLGIPIVEYPKVPRDEQSYLYRKGYHRDSRPKVVDLEESGKVQKMYRKCGNVEVRFCGIFELR